MSWSPSIDFSTLIPLLPLPDMVLFPRAVLPLHIFEPRYQEMTRDVLGGARLVAVALLRPGYAAKYHTLDAEIHPVVCVGHVLREERLADGRHNLLIQGIVRAGVVEEDRELTYRRARLRPLLPDPIEDEAQSSLRCELHRALNEPLLADLTSRTDCLVFLKCSSLCLSDVLDLLASVVLRTVEEKQAFLSELGVQPRANSLRQALKSLAAEYLEHARSECRGSRGWPPRTQSN